MSIYILSVLIGLLIGSFYAALADRVLLYIYGSERKRTDRWELIFFKPSHCFSCGQRIPIQYLIPLFGYIASRGRCSRCGVPISPRLFYLELLTGILFPWLFYGSGSFAFALFSTILAGQLYISIATDMRHSMLDYENTLFIYLWSAAAILAMDQGNTGTAVVMANLFTAIGMFLIFITLFFAGGMKKLGFGDVLLAPALALYAGFLWSIVLLQLASAMSIAYIYLIRKNRRATAPLGAFLAIALIAIMLLRFPIQRLFSM